MRSTNQSYIHTRVSSGSKDKSVSTNTLEAPLKVITLSVAANARSFYAFVDIWNPEKSIKIKGNNINV